MCGFMGLVILLPSTLTLYTSFRKRFENIAKEKWRREKLLSFNSDTSFALFLFDKVFAIFKLQAINSLVCCLFALISLIELYSKIFSSVWFLPKKKPFRRCFDARKSHVNVKMVLISCTSLTDETFVIQRQCQRSQNSNSLLP